jgi:hypothetical protein
VLQAVQGGRGKLGSPQHPTQSVAGATMFTVGAILITALLVWFAHKGNEQDRPTYDRADDRIWLLVLHIRQDLKLIAFLLCGVMVMLGVIADRIR